MVVYMEYIKQYHDNVYHVVRSITIYTPEMLDHYLSVITYEMIDNLTDYNNDLVISYIMDNILEYRKEEDELDPELYDALMDNAYNYIKNRLHVILEDRGRINGGDYDIIKKGDNQL